MVRRPFCYSEDVAIRLDFVVAGLALSGLAACGALVTLDNVDPSTGSSIQGADGGILEPSDGGAKVVGGSAVTTTSGYGISPGSIDFQSSPCGTKQSTPLTLTNPTDKDVTYTVTLGQNAVFTIEGADPSGVVSGTIPAKGKKDLVIDATANTSGDVGANVQVKLGDDTNVINATLETTGGSLGFDPPIVDFGTVRANTASQQQTVTFHNSGNADVTVGGFTNADGFVAPTNLKIAAGASITGMFSMAAGPAGDKISTDAVPTITSGALCGSPPKLTLSGQRVSTDVTVSPATLALGSPDCASAPPAATQPVTLSNFSVDGPANYSIVLPGNSRFKVANPSGQIPQATAGSPSATPGTVQLTVGVASVPTAPGPYSEQLEIDITADGGTQTKSIVTLSMMVGGAVVTLDTTSGTAPIPYFPYGVGIKNTGTQTICVQYASDEDALSLITHGDTIAPADQNDEIDFKYDQQNNSDNSRSGNITIKEVNCNGQSSSPKLCSPMPSLKIQYRF